MAESEWALFRKGGVFEFKLQKRGLGKAIVVLKSLFWLLLLLLWGIPLFLSSSCAVAPSFMKLYVLLCHHFFYGLVFPTLLLSSQFQTNPLISVLLFLWFQKIFRYLLSHPELPLPFTFVSDTSDMMIYSE